MSSPEVPVAERPPNGSSRSSRGYSVNKGSITTNENTSAPLKPGQLGASGIPSSRRSAVTKSFQGRGQGGFDEDGDPDKGMEEIAILASSRPSRMSNLISQAMGDQPDDVKHCCCIPITNNVKALFIMMIMFAAISLGQYFAAIAANSQSLKADVISMAVDALSYLGNIIGESSDVPSQRIVLQLFFSMVSLVLLNYFNTTILIESIGLLDTSQEDEEEGEEGEGVEGKIVLSFALLGLLFDFVCLYAYYYYAKKDADLEYTEMMRIAETEGKNLEEAKASIKKPEINMLTALLHVSADLMRSTATFVEGILLLAGGLSPDEQVFTDAIVGIIIGASIYLASIYAVYEWVTSFWKWFSSLGDAIEVKCPECWAQIEIKPDKAGHGKAADAFIG